MKALQLILTIGFMTAIATTVKADDYASLMEASSSNPVDATWLITNPSFETGDMQGWTRNPDITDDIEFGVRDYGMTGKDGRYLFNAYRWWASSLSVSQTIEAIPSGEYEISAVVATWAGRTVTFSANGKTITSTGINDATGIPVSMPITIGNEGKLTIEAGSTAAWWLDGHGDETQTFFKLDNVRLLCKGLFLNGIAQPLPNDNQTPLKANQWYYFDAPFSTQYLLFGNTSGMVWSTDGTSLLDDIQEQAVEKKMTIQRGRIFFKTPQSGATLTIVMERELKEETFTATALNVDGLPQKILGFIEVNPDGPGSDGTKLISQYLAKKGYDIIGVSEDFNYHGSLMSALSDDYDSGTVRATLSLWNLNYPFDTDGLNLIWKKNKVSADNENWTPWTETTNDEGNQYIKKGFRHYDLTIVEGIVIDLYVLHMDAGEAISSRQAQWKQLATAINAADSKRPKIILGDTNSRWTREDINTYFTKIINGYTMSDAWVELCRNNIYPNTSMGDITDQSDPANFSNYEVVDKIIYLNPSAADTPLLKAESFCIEQDYTYGAVQGTNNTQALGDHRPVVVDFSCTAAGDIRFTLGDVDRNGVIDISDVIVIVNIILGNSNGEPYLYSRFSADVNQDGFIDISDVIAVVNIILAM